MKRGPLSRDPLDLHVAAFKSKMNKVVKDLSSKTFLLERFAKNVLLS